MGPYELKDQASTEVAILGSSKLPVLAKAIVDSFKFDFDSPYGFYNNLESWSDSDEVYEENDFMFDEEEQLPSIEAHIVKVETAFSQIGKKFTFIYNYSDWWSFTVELLRVEVVDEKVKYPSVLKIAGTLPEYWFDSEEPDWEDDDCGVCAFMKKSEELGRTPGVEEMTSVINQQNSLNLINSLKKPD